jgi:hypothetical protein
MFAVLNQARSGVKLERWSAIGAFANLFVERVAENDQVGTP